jgi:hypothetical protein
VEERHRTTIQRVTRPNEEVRDAISVDVNPGASLGRRRACIAALSACQAPHEWNG